MARLVSLVFGLCLLASAWRQNEAVVIENCLWSSTIQVSSMSQRITLSMPSIDVTGGLAAGLICRTTIFAKYELLIKIDNFELQGPSECTIQSERLNITQGYGSSSIGGLSWCGKMYPEALFLKSIVTLTYYSGHLGQGPGFSMTIKQVRRACSEAIAFNAVAAPRLLYSPYYPSRYEKNLKCDFVINAPRGQQVQVTSRVMDLEEGSRPGCEYDYVSFNKERFCGQSEINVFNDSHMDVVFSTDTTQQEQGFVLEYRAVVLDNFTGSAKENGKTVTAAGIDVRHSVNFLMDNSLTNERSYTLTLDSGSDDAVLSVSIPDPNHGTDLCQNVEFNARFELSGSWTIQDCRVPFDLLYTPGRTLVFQVKIKSGDVRLTDFQVRFTALTKGSLPSKVTAGSRMSFLWIDRGVGQSLQVRPDRSTSGHCILFEAASKDLVYTDENLRGQDNPAEDFSLPVSSKVHIYNGANQTYFELTKDCNRQTRPDTRIFTIKNVQLAAVKVKSNVTGFWLAFQQSDLCHGLPPIELTDQTFQWSTEGKRNSECTWIIDNPRKKWIRFKSENNLSGSSLIRLQQVMDTGGNDLALINKNKSNGLWVYSNQSLNVTLDIVEQQSRVAFQYDIMENTQEYGLVTRCYREVLTARDYLQNASSINFPNSYLLDLDCSWDIKRPLGVIDKELELNFTDLPCGFGNDRLSVVSRGIPTRNLCHQPPREPLIYEEDVTVIFNSDSEKVQKGFSFSYRLADLAMHCGQSFTLQEMDFELQLKGRFASPMDCMMIVSAPDGYWLQFDVQTLDINGGDPCLPNADYNTVEFIDDYRKSTSTTLCQFELKENPVVVHSSRVTVSIRMRANSYSQIQIADFLFAVTLKKPPCGDNNIIVGRSGYILYNPTYPMNSPDSDCEWILSASSPDNILELTTEHIYFPDCYRGYLEIFDGPSRYSTYLRKICANYHTVVSSGDSLFIRFKGTGIFRLTIVEKAQPQPTASDSTSSGNQTGMIIGSILGTVSVLVVLFVIGVVYMKRRRPPPRQNTPSVAINRRESSVYIVSPVIVTNGQPPPYPGRSDTSDYPATNSAGSRNHRDPPPRYDQQDEEPPPYIQLSGLQADNHSYDNGPESPVEVPVYSLASPVDMAHPSVSGDGNPYNVPEPSGEPPPMYTPLVPDSNPPPYTAGREPQRRGHLGPL